MKRAYLAVLTLLIVASLAMIFAGAGCTDAQLAAFRKDHPNAAAAIDKGAGPTTQAAGNPIIQTVAGVNPYFAYSLAVLGGLAGYWLKHSRSKPGDGSATGLPAIAGGPS
jgi:hypothetical protein